MAHSLPLGVAHWMSLPAQDEVSWFPHAASSGAANRSGVFPGPANIIDAPAGAMEAFVERTGMPEG